MGEHVVVLGSGYGGAAAVKRLERASADVSVTWVSDTDYHLVLHEVHRVVRDPAVAGKITIGVEEIASPETTFVRGRVVGLDADARSVALADGRTIEYDYLVVALGSETAFYDIPGLEEHGLTLKGLDDARSIHDAISEAAERAGARIVVGGAGFSGVQTAGEVAAYRDEHDVPIDVELLEALPEILHGRDPALQAAVRRRLRRRGIGIRVDAPIVEVTPDVVRFRDGEPLPYDVFVWTGGILGPRALENPQFERNRNRLHVDATLRTHDDRVFAVGDAAMVDQGDGYAPATAQAALQAGAVAGENIARAVGGRPLDRFAFTDRGTLVSIGEDAIAHDVSGVPVTTFDSIPARVLKKFVAARWIASLSSWRRAARAWPDL